MSARVAQLLLCCVALWLSGHGAAHAQQPAPQQAHEQAAAQPTAALPAPPKKHKKKRKHRVRSHLPAPAPTGVVVGARVKSFAGAMSGSLERKERAALVGLEGELVPTWSVQSATFSWQGAVAHTETLGADLEESRAETALRVEYRVVPELRLKAYAGLRLYDRPSWPDLYQPVGKALLRTARYSHWDRRGGGGLTWHPAAHHWIRAAYDYTLSDYRADPSFEAVARPNHLTPFDGLEHSAELSYRFAGRDIKVGAGASGYTNEAFFIYARDAHTGKTHAGPGGLPSNPLQALRGVAPEIELELEALHDRLSVELRYRHELHEDSFQGYYSHAGPHPRLRVSYALIPALTLSTAADGSWQRYGANSYRLGPGRPALDSGDRRYDHRYQLELGAHLRVAKRVVVALDASYLVRRTNFPDYQPGVFPVSTRRVLGYDIDWDYDNALLTLGIEARNDWF